MKDYYEIMGISQDAKEEEIKPAPGVVWADDGILQKEGLRKKGV